MIPIHVMTVSGFDPRRDDMVHWWMTTYPNSVCVHDDRERHGILANHLSIVQCMEQRGDAWQMSVQDDVSPLVGWEEHIDRIAETAPTPFVSLAHLASRGAQAASKGAPYATGMNLIWGMAVMYRKDVLPSYLDLVHDVYNMGIPEYETWDDGLFAVYNGLHGTKSAITSRALFQHNDWKSTVNHTSRPRRATLTIHDDGPDWAARPRSISLPTERLDSGHRLMIDRVKNYRRAMGLNR